ncbi:MAG: S8 family serine peptidase [Cyclobacteriaceae bacterium]|nr:S8 family serine peptidase [Cyclobacteriaceae bacterium]MCH8517666.1 S8 family serine peptidase [Cyclobacteriaceae bacterium]
MRFLLLTTLLFLSPYIVFSQGISPIIDSDRQLQLSLISEGKSPKRYLVKFNSQDLAELYLNEAASKKNHSNVHLREFDNRVFDKISGKSFLKRESGRLKSLDGLVELSFDTEVTSEIYNFFSNNPDVRYFEEYPIYFVHQSNEPEKVEFNDPRFTSGDQYALNLISARQGLALLDNPTPIRVAVVDDAVYVDHPDLFDNVDLAASFDVADNNDNPNPPLEGQNIASEFRFSHGTHVAGIIGATSNNSLGIASIGNNILQIVGIKATRNNTSNTRAIEQPILGVSRAISNGARVINMSFGGPSFSQAFQDIINEATEDGVVFVASAGNGNTQTKSYPAAYDNVISVANTDRNDRKSPSSHFGEWVDISAPGTDILSTVVAQGAQGGTFVNYSGTSMSGPMVAALVGLLLADNPNLNFDEVLDIIQRSADPIDDFNPGFEGLLGSGRINVYNALLSARGDSGIPLARFSNSRTDIRAGQPVSFQSQSLGLGLNVEWSFGPDASLASSSEINPTVFFNQPTDSAFAILTVTNDVGQSRDTLFFSVGDEINCELFNFRLGDERSFFSYIEPNSGPVTGHNSLNHTAYANRYFLTPGLAITGALFSVQAANSLDAANQTVVFKLYSASGSSLVPGQVLAEKSIKYSEIKTISSSDSLTTKGDYFELQWDQPVFVPDNGYIHLGYEINYESENEFAVFLRQGNGISGEDIFLRSGGSWIPFSAFNGLDAKLDMAPVIVDQQFLPTGTIGVDVSELCLADSSLVSFSADSIQNIMIDDLLWEFSGADIDSSTSAQPEVKFIEEGEHLITLRAKLEGCTDAFVLFQTFVTVVNCDKTPVADFSAPNRIVAQGESVRFENRSENGTNFQWTFVGGDISASTRRNPQVLYDSVGFFDVSLKTSNPLDINDSISRESFIQVYEKGDCEFTYFPLQGTPSEGIESSLGGSFSGHNQNGILAYANYFELNSNQKTNGGRFWVSRVNSDQPDLAKIIIHLWKGTISDGPINSLRSREVSFSQLNSALINNDGFLDLYFEEAVSNDELEEGEVLFLGFELFYDGLGEMSLFSNSLDDSPEFGERTYLKIDDGWATYSQVSGGQFTFDIAIFPSVFDRNIDIISPDFLLDGISTVSSDTLQIELGQSIELEALNSDALIYDWTVNEGVFSSPTESSTNLFFQTLGLKYVTLTTQGNCESARKSKTIVIDLVGNNVQGIIKFRDPETGDEITSNRLDFNSSVIIDGSESIEFTSFSWDGAQWFTSQLENQSDSLVLKIDLTERGDFAVVLNVDFEGLRSDRKVKSFRVDFPLSISEEVGSLKVYPNPVSQVLNIDSSITNSENAYYSIISLSGNSLVSKKLRGSQIDISHLSNGVYILQVNDDKTSSRIKFIKN